MKLTDVTSSKLAELVARWQKEGVMVMVAQDDELQQGQASGDAGANIPFTSANAHIFRVQLLIAGFEVQTA